MNDRYARQLALPELTAAHQEKLGGTKLIMIGAGGLGAAALPYLAGAGIGHITIVDHDAVAVSNLHRQTIYKDSDAGKNKAILAAAYIKSLNPEIETRAIPQKLDPQNAEELCSGFHLILDGSDDFQTKSLLNAVSIRMKTPLISASVDGYDGMAGIFAGYAKDAPCYHCLYPELPLDCGDCAEGGILGTVAGLAGMYQAHLALCFLLGNEGIVPGTVLSLDFRYFRMRHLSLPKNPECAHCQSTPSLQGEGKIIPLLRPEDITNHLIIDVRTHEEIAASPITGALHMPMGEITARYRELPKDKTLAFACASNIRSYKAAEFMALMGYENVCVLDQLAA